MSAEDRIERTVSSLPQRGPYEARALEEMRCWQREMTAPPRFWNQAARALQRRVNRVIPERVHEAITSVIKQMTRAVLAGSSFTAPAPRESGTLAEREQAITTRIDRYCRAAALEGGITGAGGLFLGLADFPLLLGIKLKLLFDIAALYGHSGADFRERVYILYVFQLAFSSDAHRTDIYCKITDWEARAAQLPDSIDELDWRAFQQEYRDYIDFAKLAQLVPVIGAPVGVIVNNRLVKKLGYMAMNAYRMRWFEREGLK
ncbi:MAG TPA: EcsC family protein [Steroidobacter sp.]